MQQKLCKNEDKMNKWGWQLVHARRALVVCEMKKMVAAEFDAYKNRGRIYAKYRLAWHGMHGYWSYQIRIRWETDGEDRNGMHAITNSIKHFSCVCMCYLASCFYIPYQLLFCVSECNYWYNANKILSPNF